METTPFPLKQCLRITLLTSLVLPAAIHAQKTVEKNAIRRPAPNSTQATWAKRALQGFGMKVWLSNQLVSGQKAWDNDIASQDPPFGLEYPPGSGIEHLFGGGPVLGAIVNGGRRVTPAYNTFSGDGLFRTDSWDTLFITGLYAPSGANRAGVDDDGDGLTDEDDLDGLDNDGDWIEATDDLGRDGLPDSLETGCRGGYDPVSNPDPAFDNFSAFGRDSCNGNRFMYDPHIYTQNNHVPDRGEPHVDEDFGAVSARDVYCSATDQYAQAGHRPLGARMIQKSYAWDSASAAGAIVFLDYLAVNASDTLWEDAYFGFKADMDVGSVSNPGYYGANYARYDPGSRTAYVTNMVDSISTPLGLTLIGTSESTDTLADDFYRWMNIRWQFTWEDEDSSAYGLMSCEFFPCIYPDQSPEWPADIRVMLGTGPFQVQPSETLRATYALVSGFGAMDMLNNARRARRIHERRGFIMPAAWETPAAGNGFALAWHPVDRSPFGAVTSYRVYAGSTPGIWTDSLTTTDTTAEFLPPVAMASYYYAVAAIDEQGNIGALSDIVTPAPSFPRDLHAEDGERGIPLRWRPNEEFDLAGYNIYRRTPAETAGVKINDLLVTATGYFDSTVSGSFLFTYTVRAVDGNGNEGSPSEEASARLIPPAKPRTMAIGPRPASIALSWLPNTEPDLLGYNIYRRKETDSVFTMLNSVTLDTTFYLDTGVIPETSYVYAVEAVDSTLAVSRNRDSVRAHTAVLGPGVAVLSSCQNSPFAGREAAAVLYDSLLRQFQYHVFPGIIPIEFTLSNPASVYTLAGYSAVLLLGESAIPGSGFLYLDFSYPAGLKGYLMAGGKLAIIGRNLTTITPDWSLFLHEYFGLTDTAIHAISDTIFAGAAGQQGFPDVAVDAAVTDTTGGAVDRVEWFPYVPPERVLATYRTAPFRDSIEGMPVGLRGLPPDTQLYYFSFPLIALRFDDAQALLAKILSDFDVPTGIEDDAEGRLPEAYLLEQAYPNPFNPTTTIRYQLPRASVVTLRVFDALGRLVSVLAEGVREPGYATVEWNASACASGVYFYRLEAVPVGDPSGGFTDVKKMMVVR